MTNAAKSPPKKDSSLTELPFSYPFRKPGEKEFTDEHEFHKLLADESTGFFPISDSGMWHGGIHVGNRCRKTARSEIRGSLYR